MVMLLVSLNGKQIILRSLQLHLRKELLHHKNLLIVLLFISHPQLFKLPLYPQQELVSYNHLQMLHLKILQEPKKKN